jgi:hypothetical protein
VLGHYHVFGKGPVPPVFVAGDPQNRPMIAEVGLAVLTVKTGTTINSRIEGDPVPDFETLYFFAQSGDIPGGLVAHDDRRFPPACGTVKTMDIGTADRYRLNPHQNIMIPSDSRVRYIGIL